MSIRSKISISILLFTLSFNLFFDLILHYISIDLYIFHFCRPYCLSGDPIHLISPLITHYYFFHFVANIFSIEQQKATLKTVEPKEAKHAKLTPGKKPEDLPEIEDYERPALEKFEKPEFGKAEKPKRVSYSYFSIENNNRKYFCLFLFGNH